MSRTRRVLVVVSIIVALAAMIAAAVMVVQAKQARLAAAPEVSTRPLAVRTVQVQSRPWSLVREVPARYAVHEPVELAPRITAAVQAVQVEAGDTVRAGQLLVELDEAELAAQVASARAAVQAAEQQRAASQASLAALRSTLAYWQRESERHEVLRAGESVSASQAEAVFEKRDDAAGRVAATEAQTAQRQAEIEAARARLSEAELRRSWTGLRAPSDGVVARRLADPGDHAPAGQAVLELLPAARRLWLDLPPDDRALVTLGQEVFAGDADDPQASALGRVIAIHPAVDELGLFRVEVELTAPLAPPPPVGATRSVRLVLDRHEAASAVPAEALVPTPEGGWAVFAVSDGSLQPIRVQRLGADAGQVFCEGVEAGTRVVASGYLGWNRLAAGLEVVELP